ncbi:MAG TPA: TolC family protein, partial [Terriglobia bacterium]|nr:TolC family protein [Terriglobia bacterium]
LLKTTVEMNNVGIDVDARSVAYKNALLALAQSAGLRSSDVPDVDTTLFVIPYDTTFAADRNVDLASQGLALRQSELEAQIAGSRIWPNVSLAADAGALTSLPNLEQGFSNVLGASVGLSVTVPFLTFGSVHDNYLAAQATAKSISLQNDFAGTSLRHEFTMTKNTIDKARSAILSLQENLTVAEQNLLLSKARYAGGSGLSLEVLDAIRMVNQIRLSIEESRSEMTTNILKLNRLNYSGAPQE